MDKLATLNLLKRTENRDKSIQSEGCYVPSLSFRNYIIYDDVDHGTSGKCKAIRKEGNDVADQQSPKDACQRLHNATQLAVPKTTVLSVPLIFADTTSRFYQMLFALENPAAFSGRLTARPSGKFCMPIPMAKFLKKQILQASITVIHSRVNKVQ